MSTAPTTTASHALSKRLQQELMTLSMNPEKGVSAFPEGDSLLRWIGTIEGPSGTAYDGLTYKLNLVFPAEYPFKPPEVTFRTLCYHPNVSEQGGICLDILKSKWSPLLSIRTVLISIRSLLGEPNTNSPLNSEAAVLWANQTEFRETVKEKYDQNACKVINRTRH